MKLSMISIGSLNKLVCLIGQNRRVKDISTLELQNYKVIIKLSTPNNGRYNGVDGTGFYTLRRTAATIAARSGDPFAVQWLRGMFRMFQSRQMKS